ncbi:MAG: Flp family type IVb pilin [candidate division WOR-3 bacterium]
MLDLHNRYILGFKSQKNIGGFKMKFLRCERGATAVEYAMIIGLIALFAFAAYKALGKQVQRVIHEMWNKMTEASAGPE